MKLKYLSVLPSDIFFCHFQNVGPDSEFILTYESLSFLAYSSNGNEFIEIIKI